jgi:Tfx family DNA-binding protein
VTIIANYGLLTRKQYYVLKRRFEGATQDAIAKELNTTRANVSIIEDNALKKIAIAMKTLQIVKELLSIKIIEIDPPADIFTILQIVFNEADKLNIKLKTDMIHLMNMFRTKASKCFERKKLKSKLKILIFYEGSIDIYCEENEFCKNIEKFSKSQFQKIVKCILSL